MACCNVHFAGDVENRREDWVNWTAMNEFAAEAATKFEDDEGDESCQGKDEGEDENHHDESEASDDGSWNFVAKREPSPT